MTYREVLEGQLERTKHPKRRAELEALLECPPLPKSLSHVWVAFNRIRRRIGSSGFGVSPISWTEIDAFLRLSRTRLTPWEIEIVEDLDNIFLAEQAKALKPEDQDATE